MSKLEEEELLRWLGQAHRYFTFEPPGKDEQAYQQIKERVQAYAQCQEIKADYMNMILQRDLLQAQLEKKKPRVTEEWIQKAIDYIAEYPSYKRLEKKLKEAGVEVAGSKEEKGQNDNSKD